MELQPSALREGSPLDAVVTNNNEVLRMQNFKRNKPLGEEPTKKQTKRDLNALLNGKRDGKLVIENIKPKAVGGVHKVLDEKFTNNEQYKETDQGEIKE